MEVYFNNNTKKVLLTWSDEA